jgi:carbamoylphosphate synthase large subunit
MLVPAHDGSIGALRARRAEFERRTALALASEPALEIAVSKDRTLSLAARLGIPVPRSATVRHPVDIDAAMTEIGFPLVVKPFESWVESNGVGIRLSSEAFQDPTRARQRLEKIFAVGGRGALVQQWLPGRREAVSLFYAEGHFWARLAQVSYREWPVMGGASVLCEAIPLLPDITSASERLVRAMDLEGCSMVEFRRDRDGRAVLMEVNPRMGGSVQLSINSGVNFPKLMYDWKVAGRLAEVPTYRPGQRIRWLAGDVWNLKSVFANQGDPDIPPRGEALKQFMVDSLRFDNKLDIVEFGDMQPAMSEFNKVVMQHGMHRLRQLFSINRASPSERVR